MHATQIKPKRRLGQNFLVDKNITQKIIAACNLQAEDIILEIGPGLGALTEEIRKYVKKIIAVEADKALCENLQRRFAGSPVEIIHADFLKLNFDSLPHNMKAVGNLPYNISSPIMGRILENKSHFTQAFFTVQLEFGKRMVAVPGTKDYSALTCFVQYYTDAKMLFKIKGSAFRPIPKVDSCFMQLTIKQQPLPSATDEELLSKIIHQGFQQRRKTILNSLSSIAEKRELQNIFTAHSLSASLRAENLTMADYVNISNDICRTRQREGN